MDPSALPRCLQITVTRNGAKPHLPFEPLWAGILDAKPQTFWTKFDWGCNLRSLAGDDGSLTRQAELVRLPELKRVEVSRELLVPPPPHYFMRTAGCILATSKLNSNSSAEVALNLTPELILIRIPTQPLGPSLVVPHPHWGPLPEHPPFLVKSVG